MPTDPAALAQNLSTLATLDAEHDLARAMQQLASAAKALLRVDGALWGAPAATWPLARRIRV